MSKKPPYARQTSQKTTTKLGRFRRGQNGTASIEFAVILPLLLALMTAAFEVGHLLWDYHILTKAVRDGARFASRLPADCAGLINPGDITNVQQLTRTGTIDGSGNPLLNNWNANNTITISTTCFDNSGATYTGLYTDQEQIPRITVRAEVNYTYMLAGFLFDDQATLVATHQQSSIGE